MVVKHPPANAGDPGSFPGSGRSPPSHRRREWQPTPVLLPQRIPWTEEPGGVQSMGVQSMDWQRVRHD